MIIQWISKFDGVQMLWQMLSSLLLLISLLPGCIALTTRDSWFRNVLAVPEQWLGFVVIHSMVWLLLLFSLALGPSAGTIPQQGVTKAPAAMEDMIREANQIVDQRHLFGRGGVVGDLQFAGFRNLEVQGNTEEPLFASKRPPYGAVSLVALLTFHLSVYLCAVLTVMVVASSSKAKPMRLLLFSLLWGLLVYAPTVHWVWGEGWLGIAGAMDEGGSLLILIVCASVLGIFRYCRSEMSDAGHISAPSSRESVILHSSSIVFVFGYLVLMSSMRLPISHIRSAAILNGIVSACGGYLVYCLMKSLMPDQAHRQTTVTGFCCGIVSVAAGCTMYDPRTALTCGVIGGVGGFIAWAIALRCRFSSLLEFPVATVAASITGMLFVGICGSSANGVLHWNRELVNSLMHGEMTLLKQQALTVVAIFVYVLSISRLLGKVCLKAARISTHKATSHDTAQGHI